MSSSVSDYELVILNTKGEHFADLTYTREEFIPLAQIAKKYCTRKDHRCHITCQDAWSRFLETAIKEFIAAEEKK